LGFCTSNKIGRCTSNAKRRRGLVTNKKKRGEKEKSHIYTRGLENSGVPPLMQPPWNRYLYLPTIFLEKFFTCLLTLVWEVGFLKAPSPLGLYRTRLYPRGELFYSLAINLWSYGV
jgi:hypothetical protein